MRLAIDDICCIWNADNHEAFATAQRHRAFVKVVCCIPWKGAPKDVLLYGRLRNVSGREATLVVLQALSLIHICVEGCGKVAKKIHAVLVVAFGDAASLPCQVSQICLKGFQRTDDTALFLSLIHI